MEDFSQYKEQAVILEYFKHQLGCFLDIGANDGKTLSNTYALAGLGWRGVLVEPSEIPFQKLQKLYSYGTPEYFRPVNAAIVKKDGPVDFWENGSHLGKGDTSLLASTIEASTKNWGETFKKVTVPGMTFATMMEKTGLMHFDFINIDCEGADWDVLEQINLTEVGCRLLCIETNGPISGNVKMYVAAHGMRLIWRCHVNAIFGK